MKKLRIFPEFLIINNFWYTGYRIYFIVFLVIYRKNLKGLIKKKFKSSYFYKNTKYIRTKANPHPFINIYKSTYFYPIYPRDIVLTPM
jgi:hypothetical protein